MSAAATAAGYLYASGRLRGRNGRDNNDSHDNEHHRDNERHYGSRGERDAGAHGDRGLGARGERAQEAKKPAVRVAVYHSQTQAPQAPAPQSAAPVAKKTPKIEYRTRRWRPE
jgi:hypothetical protein